MDRLKDIQIENLIFHYNILRGTISTDTNYSLDTSLDVLKTADEIHIFTIWTEPDRLRKQLYDNEIRNKKKE